MGAESEFDRLFAAVESVGEADGRRREVFREEFDAYEDGTLDRFERTRAAIASEREHLEDLDDRLAEETERIEGLGDAADYLSVDQAVRNRDEALAKLREHNEALRTFHDEVSAALDAIEANLDAVEADGPGAVAHDPEPHLAAAREAIEAHNEAVDGLGKNLRILSAYMI